METTAERHADRLLRDVDRLRVGTRSRVRAAWFPLVVFGVITLATIPLYSRPFAYPGGGSFAFGPYLTPYYAGLPGSRSQLAAYLFWLFAAPLGYLACALWYRRRARWVGVTFRWERWVVAGLALFGLLQVMLALPVNEPGRAVADGMGGVSGELGATSPVADLLIGLAAWLSPLVAVAIGLLVLAWVERSRVVAAVAVLYGAFAIVVNTYGPGEIPPWLAPPHGATNDLFVAPAYNVIILALVLFAGAGVSAVISRRAASAG
jgi:hypothetical protein